MAKASELPELQHAFFVGQQRPLTSLAPWKQWLIRKVFDITGWCGGIEGQSICTTKERAREMCAGKPNWFVQPLPLNVALPDESCKFLGHEFPASDNPERYLDLPQLPFVAVPRNVRERELATVQAAVAQAQQLDDCLTGKCIEPA